MALFGLESDDQWGRKLSGGAGIEKRATAPAFLSRVICTGNFTEKIGITPGGILTSTSRDTSGLGPARVLLTGHDVDHCKLGPGGARGDVTDVR